MRHDVIGRFQALPNLLFIKIFSGKAIPTNSVHMICFIANHHGWVTPAIIPMNLVENIKLFTANFQENNANGNWLVI
ncbi:hypothetical protein A9J41_10975 [Laribacter hongkongensis]|nr:hypothetical protein [Laribacter hongkongensis]